MELDIVGEDGDTLLGRTLEDGEDTFYVEITGRRWPGHQDRRSVRRRRVRLDSATVEITAIGLEASPSTAVVGQEVTITGSGFDEADGSEM